MVFWSNGFQLELIDSTQPDNQIVLPGDSLLPDMVIYYCDCFCLLGAGAEDLHTILSIFPKQKPSNSFTTEGGKAGKVGPNEDESVGADLANGLSLTSWWQARNSIITVVCLLCESSIER